MRFEHSPCPTVTAQAGQSTGKASAEPPVFGTPVCGSTPFTGTSEGTGSVVEMGERCVGRAAFGDLPVEFGEPADEYPSSWVMAFGQP